MNTTEKIITDLTSVYWWFTAIVVALVINLLSAYAKPWIDRWLETFSVVRRGIKTREQALFDGSVKSLADDPYLLLLERLDEIRNRVQVIYFLIGCIIMLGAAAYFWRATDINPIFRYSIVIAAIATGLFGYLVFFRLVIRSNESSRRFEAAIKQLSKQNEA